MKNLSLNGCEPRVSKCEVGIKLDRLHEQSLGNLIILKHRVRISLDLVCPQITCVCFRIGGGYLFDTRFFLRRKFRLQLVGDRFRNFALNREYVRQITVVAICPLLSIRLGIDELRGYSNAVTSSLNASFHQMCHPELLSNLADITLRPAFVLHDAGATDHP